LRELSMGKEGKIASEPNRIEGGSQRFMGGLLSRSGGLVGPRAASKVTRQGPWLGKKKGGKKKTRRRGPLGETRNYLVFPGSSVPASRRELTEK